jgi:hypothetical protein
VINKIRDLTRGLKIEVLINGGATGVDAAARWWATQERVRVHEVLPDWEKHGKKAGPIRNQNMIRCEPTYAIAFRAHPPTPGTADMIRKLERAKIPTEIIEC